MTHNNCVPSSNWIDVSVLLREDMVVWPDSVKLQIERSHSFDRGDAFNHSIIKMGVHTGTHLDAPLHFLANGKSIDQISFDKVIGSARVIEIVDKESIKAEELMQHNIRRGERILFKTRNSGRCWRTNTFVTDFIYVTREAANFLAGIGVRLIGIDYLSVAGPLDPDKTMPDTHQILLGADIWLLEGLDLSSVSPGEYSLICLPLKLFHAEGSPVRAVLRSIS